MRSEEKYVGEKAEEDFLFRHASFPHDKQEMKFLNHLTSDAVFDGDEVADGLWVAGGMVRLAQLGDGRGWQAAYAARHVRVGLRGDAGLDLHCVSHFLSVQRSIELSSQLLDSTSEFCESKTKSFFRYIACADLLSRRLSVY